MVDLLPNYKIKDFMLMISRLKSMKLATGAELMEQLVKLDKQRYFYDPVKHRERRKIFDETKRQSFDLQGERCRVCGNWAQCRHHIFELQHGGMNHRRNIVYLCHGCHAKIHPWLQ